MGAPRHHPAHSRIIGACLSPMQGVVYQRPKKFAEQVLTFLDSAQVGLPCCPLPLLRNIGTASTCCRHQ
jgi:hypothetical protein